MMNEQEILESKQIGMSSKVDFRPYRATFFIVLISIFILMLLIIYSMVIFIERKDNLQNAGRNQNDFSIFTMESMDGQLFTPEQLKPYKLNIFNIWETECSVCVDEMPDLAELSQEWNKQGVQLIGICADISNSEGEVDEKLKKTAENILASTGANVYPQLVPSGEMVSNFIFPFVTAYPTTVFTDSEGRVIDIILGSTTKEGWKKRIEEKLNQIKARE